MGTQSSLNRVINYIARKFQQRRTKHVPAFVRDYYRDVPEEEISRRDSRSLACIALRHFELARQWTKGHRLIRVYNPELKKDGWESKYTIVQIVTANSPFLVDTVLMELSRQGYSINLTIHPLINILRGARRKFLDLVPLSTEMESDSLESFIYMEIDKETDASNLKTLSDSISSVLEDTRLAVADRMPMTKSLEQLIVELQKPSALVKVRQAKQASSFLQWLLHDNFIFLGYREFDIKQSRNKETLRVVSDSGLGILRQNKKQGGLQIDDSLSENVRSHTRSDKLLTITKSNSRSTVHRPAHLDYIRILRFNKRGNVCSEHRILGLFSSAAYMSNPHSVPLLQDKIDRVMLKSGLVADSHAGKALVNILLTYPRDELFQSDVKQLHHSAMGILHLQERQQVRVFVRRDPFDRFFACIIFVPKERYHSGIRHRIQSILSKALNGSSVDFSISISESAYAQLYLIVHTIQGSVPEYDLKNLESAVTAATISWTETLDNEIVHKYGRQQGRHYLNRYRAAFPASYMEDHTASEALEDISYIERCLDEKQLQLNLYRDAGGKGSRVMFKLFTYGAALPLSSTMPILENMGLFIHSERPYDISPAKSKTVWVHDFDMQYQDASVVNLSSVRDIFQDAFADIWNAKIENDGFNRLVLSAGINAREITLLRAYARYLRQLGSSFSEEYIQQTLIRNSDLTKLLISLFNTRFDPALTSLQRKQCKNLQRNILQALDAVSSLDEDRILRSYFNLIQATLRSNYFQINDQGQFKEHLSLKVCPEMIPDLPLPQPKYEIFVYSPRVEGVHLRGGKVARGGLRWSDRREDFRTEVLGLMKAQMVKNAVIVPVGAKGGFYVKQPPGEDRQALLQEGIYCYKTFIRGLLDITDNRVADKVLSPENVVRYDDDDPYLVVAADKGTATFSDIANELSAEYKFWLGDAFASGGSVGYDHKKMGITARGAWESVKYNFQTLGIDTQNEAFSVVGIGDMSGDVFGNGMLLSTHIKLIAAFNHLHIFIDPDPDPTLSFRERKRLFELPRSSWSDYDSNLISKGGGVYSRSLKSIQLSEELRALLKVDLKECSPDELIRLLLTAPVDLLWNGGIGTYVKADSELNTDVGDKTNDGLRINSSQLRCRVIGEGGNLGFTQKARIAFANKQGRVNADWVDNSGGVHCSDREVNIKILLNKLVDEDKLSLPQRNRLLRKMTGDVAEMVLQDNYRQVRAIDVIQIESGNRPGWYEFLIDELEKTENFSRRLENIPDKAALEKRKARQKGFSHPEVATLLAHTKTAIYNELLDSSLPDDAYLCGMLLRYFPVQIQKKYDSAIREHRLRNEIITTVLTNSMVNRAGITFAHRLADESGASIAMVSKAFLLARDIFDIHGLWRQIDKLDNQTPTISQAQLVFETQHLLRHATRWFVRHEEYLEQVSDTVSHYSAIVKLMKLSLRKLLTGVVRKSINTKIRDYRDSGVPARIASRFASLRVIIISLELGQLCLQKNYEPGLIFEVFFLIDTRLKIYSLRYNADTLNTDNVWQDRARVDFSQRLNQLQAELTSQALSSHAKGEEAAQIVERWLRKNNNAVEQYWKVYDKMMFSETRELAMISVVMGKLSKFS